ncbi:MAG TPA: relaxase/mobilization nuclease domain-containing protein [Niabella sp.]|nr:relaxase/mobilization nuclease domain-containing protein [Niabella sp.]HUN01221.1 relaxase/mobilization nuclease domain-containing protein [Niabella sp.]
MVAVVNPSRSLRNALHYNENKLKIVIDEKRGIHAAKLIHAVNYGKDTEELGFTDKIRTLEKLTELNQNTKVNCVHISLNFDPSEKDLSEDVLCRIAENYMKKIGFGAQPYLVYQHNDSSHPHIHIVTTNIQRNAKRIELHNIGKVQSEKARKEIEREFNLVRADQRQRLRQYEIKPVNAQKVTYGRSAKSGTKRAITNVLDAVLPQYRYTSLPELNAVLQQYNIVADQGGKDSRIYKNNGLVYRVLDEQGKKVGVPIPASHIYNKPTLKFLQQRFIENEPARQKHKARVKNAIDLAIAIHPGLSIKDLVLALQKERIQLVLRQNTSGIIYGLTYVDHQTRCVFNGSDLGKPYSANQVQQRCNQSMALALKQSQHKELLNIPPPPISTTAIETILQPEYEGLPPSELREELKKRKRKKIRH